MPNVPADQGDRDRGQPLAPAGEAEPVGGGAGDASRARRRAAESTACASARRVPIFGATPITWIETLPISNPAARTRARGLAEQSHAGRAGPLRAVGAEVGAEVAEAGRGEQRVAGGVRGHVTVGVTGQPAHVRPEQPGHPARPAGVEGVHVRADADPGNDHDPQGSRGRRPSPRSSSSADGPDRPAG